MLSGAPMRVRWCWPCPWWYWACLAVLSLVFFIAASSQQTTNSQGQQQLTHLGVTLLLCAGSLVLLLLLCVGIDCVVLLLRNGHTEVHSHPPSASEVSG